MQEIDEPVLYDGLELRLVFKADDYCDGSNALLIDSRDRLYLETFRFGKLLSQNVKWVDLSEAVQEDLGAAVSIERALQWYAKVASCGQAFTNNNFNKLCRQPAVAIQIEALSLVA
jgi:hypothetical protein